MKYTLTTEKFIAEFDTCGGQLISLKNIDGKEHLWCGDPEYWAGNAPVLFPIVGAMKNDLAEIKGKEYTIPKHGLVRKKDFEMTEMTEDEIEFTIKSSEETLKAYPYEFILKVRHIIKENGFSTTYTVKNVNDEDMEMCIGGHPSFSCPLDLGESFEDYKLTFDKPIEKLPVYTDSDSIIHRDFQTDVIENGDTLLLKYSVFDNDAIIFEDIEARNILVSNVKTGDKFKFSFYNFANLVIWTPPKKSAPFFCLEPWQGLPAYIEDTADFSKKKDVVTLKSGEEYTAGYGIEII